MRRLPLVLLAALGACASGPTEEELARVEDYFTRGSQYYAAGRYAQAYDQARRALELDPESGRLNLLAGRSLLMQRGLRPVADARFHLEKAVAELENYKAPYSLAEFHYRYGSLLTDYAQKEREDLERYPDSDTGFHAQRLRENERRLEKAEQHFADAAELLEEVREEVPEDLDTLEMLGQVRSLQGRDAAAQEALGAALEILKTSREYKNYVLGTDDQLTIEEERRLRADLAGDIRREVAILYVVAGLHQRASDLSAEEAAYDRILALAPDESGARYSRGQVRYELGRLSEAAADMRAFVASTDLGPDSLEVQRAVDVVREFEELQSGARPLSRP